MDITNISQQIIELEEELEFIDKISSMTELPKSGFSP